MHFDFLWRDYRYFDYERNLALRELMALANSKPSATTGGLSVALGPNWENVVNQTTYFGSVKTPQGVTYIPRQTKLETAMTDIDNQLVYRSTLKKQNTRYSVHGLHDYKGKFNPQTAKAILNVLGAKDGEVVVDPFCGSGTTLVECIHKDLRAIGFDLNPLAVFISNAKILALSVHADQLKPVLNKIVLGYNSGHFSLSPNHDRKEYLAKWFDVELLKQVEQLKKSIDANGDIFSNIFLAIASDLLRDFSQQEPQDLRIRRRFSPMPMKTLIQNFEEKANNFIISLRLAQTVIGIHPITSYSYVCDSRNLKHCLPEKSLFDLAITSPPYATALPYIDTQRLSLVWLGLISPQEIKKLDAELTGSREIQAYEKSFAPAMVYDNTRHLPPEIHNFCLKLANALTKDDGFRRKAVPYLLYRYFSDMQDMFREMHTIMKMNAPFALVVGHNHTILGGNRFEINTPSWLAKIAAANGWMHKESITLQTYHRYNIHSSNSVREETLLILENNR